MVVPGGMPAGRSALEGSEAMASSDTVVSAFLGMCETDYRGALRSLVTAGNPQMTEEEIRERVRLQAEHQPQEAAVARLRAWVDDDALEPARACGDRLWLLCSETMGGGWFPAGKEAMDAIAQALPRGTRGGGRGWPREPPRPDGGGGQANQVEVSPTRA